MYMPPKGMRVKCFYGTGRVGGGTPARGGFGDQNTGLRGSSLLTISAKRDGTGAFSAQFAHVALEQGPGSLADLLLPAGVVSAQPGLE